MADGHIIEQGTPEELFDHPKTNGRKDLSSRWESLQSLYKKGRRTMADKTFHTRLINMRRDLHEHPELSFQEVETTKNPPLA